MSWRSEPIPPAPSAEMDPVSVADRAFSHAFAWAIVCDLPEDWRIVEETFAWLCQHDPSARVGTRVQDLEARYPDPLSRARMRAHGVVPLS